MSAQKARVLEIIAEVIEADLHEINAESLLDDYYWDSLAVVTFITEINSEFDKIISPAAVRASKTVNDLLVLALD